MKLFTRKMRMFCVSNIMVSFVCTGFLGINGIANNIESTTNEAHEISLTSSDTEPVSQYGEGDVKRLAFITNSLEAGISQQDSATFLKVKGEENEFAFITKSVEAVILQQEKALAEKKVEKSTSNKTTTSVVKKKEVAHSSSYKKPSYSAVTGEAIVAFAKQFMGLRYKSGTPSLTNGADCSGFTMLIYKEFGVSLSRSVSGQTGAGKYVAKSDLQKGDLVFYKAKGAKGGASHVGIYYGGGQVIHESRPGVGVKLSSVNMMQYVTARRVINSTSVKIAEQKLEEQKKKENVTDTTSTNNNTAVNSDNNVNNNVNNVVTETNTTNNVVNETTTNSTTTTTTETVNQEVVTNENSTLGGESN